MGSAGPSGSNPEKEDIVNKSVRGALVAVAVAGLFLGGQALAADDASKSEGKVKCQGANECKGKGSCGGAGHDCAGQNSCKGKGWQMMSAADCKAKGGTEMKQ